MKHMRKLVTLVVVLAMVMAFMVPTAMAATNDGSITITNAVKGETYTIYKVFDLTYDGDNVSYTYTKTGDSDALYTALTGENSPFTLTATTTANVYNVTAKSGKGESDIITFLNNNKNSLTQTASVTADETNEKFENLAYGYYYVTSTTGSVVTINSAKKDVDITDKNTVPSVNKEQSADGTSYVDTLLELGMGDTVYYQIKVTIGKGTNKNIVLADTASNGIKLNVTSITVKKVDETVDEDNYFVAVGASESGFTLTIDDAYVSTLSEGDVITIAYTATVDTDATVDNATANYNKVTMTYSAQTAEDTVYVATYDFLVKKTDANNTFLDGAEFRLYDAATGGNEIKLAADTSGCYVSTEGTATIDINNDAGVNVRGLKPGTYYLEEVVTPDGYNKLAAREAVTITSGATSAVEVTVINNAGSQLPSTGGMGTTIFYILGGLMVVGAAVVLVTNKRMRGQM